MPVPIPIPEAVAVANVVEVEPVPSSIPEAEEKWITSQELIDLLTSQDMEPVPSLRTLQNWASKFDGTKPGFSPPYTAKKDGSKLIWKPA